MVEDRLLLISLKYRQAILSNVYLRHLLVVIKAMFFFLLILYGERGVETDLCLLSRLRIHGAMPSLPHSCLFSRA
jgi:hypothetical protein